MMEAASPPSPIEEAEALERQGDLPGAEAAYRRLLAQAPGDAAGRFARPYRNFKLKHCRVCTRRFRGLTGTKQELICAGLTSATLARREGTASSSSTGLN